MISIYSDGASSAKGGKPGGWAFVIVRDEAEVLACGYGGNPNTTNNVMELTGAIEGLKKAIGLYAAGLIKPEEPWELVSDSQYVLGMASGEWHPTKNVELANEIAKLAKSLNVRIRWVPGHSGIVWNERCDSLAGRGKAEAQSQK